MRDPILILHGWGQFEPGQHRFLEVKKLLEKRGYRVFTPDLPGFGSNQLKKEKLTFEDYVEFVREYIKEKKLQQVILIGHSFGGRIAIRFTSLHPEFVKKLVLVSASGIVHPLSVKRRVVSLMVKLIKPVFSLPIIDKTSATIKGVLYKGIGEYDYYKAGNLQKTFKNIYRVSVSNDLPYINVPTLIIWGEKDSMTPLADGKYMNEKIKSSQLVIVKNEGHKYPYEKSEDFVQKITTFLS